MNTQEFYANMKTEEQNILENLKNIKHRIVVFSGKGGVGKTTFSINLAYALSKKHKVGLLDGDVTSPNIPKMMHITDKELLAKDNMIIPVEYKNVRIVSSAFMAKENDAIIWRGPLRSKLINQFLSNVEWNELDYLIADLPPGTGDEVLTITTSMKPDIAIIVTTPQEVSLGDARRAVSMAKKMVKKVYLIENMSYLICPHCGGKIDLFGEGNTKKLSEELGVELLGEIPLDVDVRKGSDSGKIGVLDFENTKFSKVILSISKRLEEEK